MTRTRKPRKPAHVCSCAACDATVAAGYLDIEKHVATCTAVRGNTQFYALRYGELIGRTGYRSHLAAELELDRVAYAIKAGGYMERAA